MADSSPLVLGIAGLGTVGSALVRILTENRAEILSRTGRDIVIKKVLDRDASRQQACPLPKDALLTADMDDLLNDPAINVVVELLGGVDTPRELILKALMAGKNVVTANKALLAENGSELFALAAEKGLYLGYEASVCGGIPIVQVLRESLAGNRLESLRGILNGTSNYILSEISARGLDFAEALKQAQKLGYAEADPTLDIEGFDAAHKLALLIRLAWGVDYPYAQLPVRGISQVQGEDITYAREFGYSIKLVAHARLVGGALAEGGGIEAEVCPTLVHQSSLMASVHGAYNAVCLEGNAVGSIFLHGKGAGGLPTSSAVASDILSIARNAIPNNTGFARPHPPVSARIMPQDESCSPYYIRMKVTDKPGVLRDIAAVMAENNISIAQVMQKDYDFKDSDSSCSAEAPSPQVPFILMTHEASTAGVHKALRTLAASSIVHESPVHYRVMVKKN
jgi:homoserine dehydrogenase